MGGGRNCEGGGHTLNSRSFTNHGREERNRSRDSQGLTAGYAAKRRILEIVLLNCRLDDTTLVLTMRKPFDIVAEGPFSNLSRGDGI